MATGANLGTTTTGVLGHGAGDQGFGVVGMGTGAQGFGVAGNTESGVGTGVHGHTSTGVGVLGTSDGSGLAGKFVGNIEVDGKFVGDVEVTGSLTVDRDINVTGDVFLANRDLAEQFEVNMAAQFKAGMLMVIGKDGTLEPCSSPYDKRAIGVVSGAGTLRPAITLGSVQSSGATVPIALVGTAFCLVDADLGSIETGDLLTSSPTMGHAMKAKDPMKSLGAIVGKALAPLREGSGLVPMVISLQ